MTNAQINMAIAEACGMHGAWELKITPCGCDGQWDYFNPQGNRLPDYCNDLNAMHEAEKFISNKHKESDYWFLLRELLDFPDAESEWDTLYFFDAIHATARQRAEAFLKTINKWED
jgi:hypothetical protein